MSRVTNFSAGPAMLPIEVLEQVKSELLEWNGVGASVMEISHRSPPFMALAEQIKTDLRELMSIPENYHILFLHGGARGQFAAVPLNLISNYPVADYVNTGIWANMAIAEARKFCEVNQVATNESSNFTLMPERASWRLSKEAAYCHIVSNETVNGLEFPDFPEVGDTPLVVDMSSNILSKPIDVSQTALIYAGAQKNAGPPGVTIVIIRDDLLARSPDNIPCILNYREEVQKESMLNTPDTFAWYVMGLVFQWIKRQGGVAEMGERNQRKSKLLYDFIDQQDFYINNIQPSSRSRMNVVFRLRDETLNNVFLEQASKAGLTNLKGHSLVGGMRASLYNAMPETGVQSLVDFMSDFARRRG